MQWKGFNHTQHPSKKQTNKQKKKSTENVMEGNAATLCPHMSSSPGLEVCPSACRVL